jgi:predicted MPP superfamily phosphohydrolase
MSRFLVFVIVIYLIPHVSLFFRLRPLVAPVMRLPLLLALLSLMSTFFAGYALRRHGQWISRPVIEVSFLWMAFVFWAFCVGLTMDAWNLLVRLVPEASRPGAIRPIVQLRVLVGMSILLFSWSAGEARRLSIRSPALPGLTAPRPVTIAFFTDLHLSPFGNKAAAERTLALLKALKPDLILCGGDLIDARASEIANDLKALAELEAPLGKFAVLGNHEYYAGLSNSLTAYQMAGFTLLRAERVEPLPGLFIAGVDDLHGKAANDICFYDEDKALPPAGTPGTTILLKHKPVWGDEAKERAQLQLSGHTHGGQIFPFHILVHLFFKQGFGLYPEGEGRWLYVSRGSSTWGPMLRLFAPPEVTFITLPGPAAGSR